jgi:hypothetical protein
MGCSRRRPAGLLLALLLGPLATGPASGPALAATSCVATYDRTGAVTGRYCSDGPAAGDEASPGAPAAPRAAARRPAARRPAARSAAHPLPRGIDIRCTGSGRCRGSFERP